MGDAGVEVEIRVHNECLDLVYILDAIYKSYHKFDIYIYLELIPLPCSRFFSFSRAVNGHICVPASYDLDTIQPLPNPSNP